MEFRKLRGMESRPLVDTVRSSLTSQLPSSPPGPLLTFVTILQARLQPPGDFKSGSPRSGTLRVGVGQGCVWGPPEAHTCSFSGRTYQSPMMTMTTWTCKSSAGPHLAPAFL